MHRLKSCIITTTIPMAISSGVITNDVDTINNTISQNLTSVVTQVTTAISVSGDDVYHQPGVSADPHPDAPLSLFSAVGDHESPAKNIMGQQQEWAS